MFLKKEVVMWEETYYRLCFVTKEQREEIRRLLEEILKKVGEGDVASPLDPEATIKALRIVLEGVFPLTDLIHGLFIPPEKQLELARRWNDLRGWGFTEEDFAKLSPPPSWPDSPLCVVVLNISLNTICMTVEEAWDIFQSVYSGNCHRHFVLTDKNHLRLLEGIVFQPRSLKWVVIDLGANVDQTPQEIHNPKNSPHSAVLWAAAYFPLWVQAMCQQRVPGVFITGYDENPVSPKFKAGWVYQILLDHCCRGEIALKAILAHSESTKHGQAVPVLLEE